MSSVKLELNVDGAGIQFSGTNFDRHSLMEPDFDWLNLHTGRIFQTTIAVWNILAQPNFNVQSAIRKYREVFA